MSWCLNRAVRETHLASQLGVGPGAVSLPGWAPLDDGDNDAPQGRRSAPRRSQSDLVPRETVNIYDPANDIAYIHLAQQPEDPEESTTACGPYSPPVRVVRQRGHRQGERGDLSTTRSASSPGPVSATTSAARAKRKQ
jgi:hypothetical protein